MTAPRSLGEQWHPTPARLTRAILEAPTAKRRQWAIEYRTMWEIVFHKASRGESVRIRELLAWGGSTNKDRASAAREDALKSFQRWEESTNGIGQNADKSRTSPGQESDKPRSVEPSVSVTNRTSLGQESDSPRTLARALPSTSTNYISTSGGVCAPPAPEQPPAPSSSAAAFEDEEIFFPEADTPAGSTDRASGLSGRRVISCWQEAYRRVHGVSGELGTRGRTIAGSLAQQLTGRVVIPTGEQLVEAMADYLQHQAAGQAFPWLHKEPHATRPALGHFTSKGTLNRFLPEASGSQAGSAGGRVVDGYWYSDAELAGRAAAPAPKPAAKWVPTPAELELMAAYDPQTAIELYGWTPEAAVAK